MGRRAILVTPDFPPLTGGIQLVLHRLVTHTETIDWEVVTLDVPGAPEFDAGRPFEVRRVGRRGGAMHKLAVAALNATGAARVLRRRPDVIVCGHVTAAPAAIAAGPLTRAPTVQYVHADEFRTRPGLTRAAVRRASAVIAVSGYTKEMALAAGAEPARLHVINPGVDLPPSAGAQPASKAERPTLLTVARMFNTYKGHDLVIRALPAVLERVPDARWVVIGDGPLRDSIEALAREHGVGEAITFLGRVSDETRDQWQRRAHVFTMPSRIPEDGAGGEGFGIVYLEAGAHGLPVVAGRIGGALDAVVDGETGVLVDPNDPHELAEALTGLLLDRERAAAMGAAGLARARRLSWDAHARAVEKVVDELLERR